MVLNISECINYYPGTFQVFVPPSNITVLPWHKTSFALHYILIITRRVGRINSAHNCWISCNILLLENYNTEVQRIPNRKIDTHPPLVTINVFYLVFRRATLHNKESNLQQQGVCTYYRSQLAHTNAFEVNYDPWYRDNHMFLQNSYHFRHMCCFLS